MATQDNQAKTSATQPPLKPIPSKFKVAEIIDPVFDFHNKVIHMSSIDPNKLLRPTSSKSWLNDQPLPFPVQWPFLMINSAVSGVSQLPEKLILNPDWYEKQEAPMIKPMPDVECVHLLFNHPRHERYNNWKTKYMYAPTIRETHIAIALRKLQKYYVQFLLMLKNKQTKNDMKKLMHHLREQFSRLNDYVQNWVIQVLVGHPDAPRVPCMRGSVYAPGKKNTKWIKKFKKENKNMQHLTTISKYWIQADESDFKSIECFPHEVFPDQYPFTIDWNRYYPYYKIDEIPEPRPRHAQAKPIYKQPVSFDGDLNELDPDDLVNGNNLNELMTNISNFSYNSDDDSVSGDSSDSSSENEKTTTTAKTPGGTQTGGNKSKQQKQNKNNKQKEANEKEGKGKENKTNDDEKEPQREPNTWYRPDGSIPNNLDEHQGVLIYYYDKAHEKHRKLEWYLERARIELEREHLFDEKNWKQIDFFFG